MVGERGFEPPTPWSRTRCSTRLSHSPTPCGRLSMKEARPALPVSIIPESPASVPNLLLAKTAADWQDHIHSNFYTRRIFSNLVSLVLDLISSSTRTIYNLSSQS